MDCCNTKKDLGCCENLSHMKGGKSKNMERRIMLWGIIAILFIIALFLIFQAGATGNTIVAESAGNVAKSVASEASYGGMVGGC